MLGRCVETGSSCEVYEWSGDGKVVKLFHTNTPLEAIQLEYRNSSSAWKSGLPVARPFELVIWEGRPGIIFEKILGETIVNRLFELLYSFRRIDFDDTDSELRIFARVLNDIHKAMSSTSLPIKRRIKKRLLAGQQCLPMTKYQPSMPILTSCPLNDNFVTVIRI